MNNHPHRDSITSELHARPFISLESPVRVLHLALIDTDNGRSAREYLRGVLTSHGVTEPGTDIGNHLITRIRSTWLKWEHHAEFTSWTLWRDAGGVVPFAEVASEDLDVDWLDGLPGELLVSVRMHVLGPNDAVPDATLLAGLFDAFSLCGSNLGEGKLTSVWTDFRPDDAGHTRMLLHDQARDARQLGRRVQRLLEIETYRCMALLGLPVARESAPRIAKAEAELARMAQNLEVFQDLEVEKGQLQALMQLSAASEELVATTAYRFSASSAYLAIVGERLERLNETTLGDLPTIGGFMARRLSPAMRTCEHTQARQEALAQRIARAANLLRTQVDLALEAQNQRLLVSMERRARLQVRLQQTVEGLSVAAITYYVVGLVSYLAKASTTAGLAVDADLVTGASVPVVALVIWRAMRRLHERIARDQEQD